MATAVISAGFAITVGYARPLGARAVSGAELALSTLAAKPPAAISAADLAVAIWLTGAHTLTTVGAGLTSWTGATAPATAVRAADLTVTGRGALG